MRTATFREAISIVASGEAESAFDRTDYREHPALWEVEYDVTGDGFCKDYLITRNHMIFTRIRNLPDAGPHDDMGSRPARRLRVHQDGQRRQDVVV